MKARTITLFLLICFFTSLSRYADAEESSIDRWILVTGEGMVEAPPDLAILRLGVKTTAKVAQQATESNNESIKKILNTLVEEDISQDDLETLNFKISPLREYRKNQPPLVIGYEVSNTLLVKVRDLVKVGEIMQLVVDSGGNDFESLTFTVEDTLPYMEEARVLAMENALYKAEMMTEALHIGVGQPLTIKGLSQGSRPIQARRMLESSVMMAKEVPIQAPEELEVRVKVEVKFALN